MNIKTSNTIRITTRNHDRTLKVPRHCVTIKKTNAVTRMATMGITQMPPMSTAKALSREKPYVLVPLIELLKLILKILRLLSI